MDEDHGEGRAHTVYPGPQTEKDSMLQAFQHRIFLARRPSSDLSISRILEQDRQFSMKNNTLVNHQQTPNEIKNQETIFLANFPRMKRQLYSFDELVHRDDPVSRKRPHHAPSSCHSAPSRWENDLPLAKNLLPYFDNVLDDLKSSSVIFQAI